MKTTILVAAALGLSVSGAAAECVGHTKTTASVDQQSKVASIANSNTPTTADTATTADPPILKKEDAKEAE
ncbi:conserved exported hypothetical protein [Mesorhizobium metallidurans STM 2683]|uniref:DUF680 domain-containing protein n=1 Tax=Mesorhizobium metallidurans STM 2683 TaxID=1297569 RepID=M5ESC0_9HYPH|nr:hypothetical protein [Mesorhizobium metallidurans]CCV06888.1 conserved exported hypothetical protein [Mesorhizobium metallidurans STM 2683]